MSQILDIFTLLFITMGPLKVSVVFAGLTAQTTPDVRRRIAIRTVSIAVTIALLFTIAGQFIVELFHFSLPSLQIAGGLILLVFAIRLVLSEGKESGAEEIVDVSPDNVSIYPLAMPLMASPMGIVVLTTISATYSDEANILVRLGILLLIIMVINLCVLLFLSQILKYIPIQIFMVAERLLGILLAALAVETVIRGLSVLGIVSLVLPAH